jgi:hypothetical protein
MGYHWLSNTDPALPFDGLMYSRAAVVVVILKKVRHALSDTCIIEKKLPDEVAAIRILPLPEYVLREIWIRTQNERAWRRFYILPETTAEIEFNTAENYRNTHYREKEWEKVPFRIDISLPLLAKNLVKRGMKSYNPVKGSFWQTDEGHFFRTGNRVRTLGKY